MDNTIFKKVPTIKIKFLKELVPNEWKTRISCSKWMEEWNNFFQLIEE